MSNGYQCARRSSFLFCFECWGGSHLTKIQQQMHSSLSIWTPSEIWDWPAKVHCDHWLLVCSNFYWTTCCHCVTKDSGLLRGFQGSNMHLTIHFGFVCCPQQKRTITKTLVVHGCSGLRLCLWLVFDFWGRYVKKTSWFVMRLTHNKHQQLWLSLSAIGPPMDLRRCFAPHGLCGYCIGTQQMAIFVGTRWERRFFESSSRRRGAKKCHA